MIQAKDVSNAKMFYNRYSDSTVMKIEIDDSVNVKTEITIAEAKQLRDDLSDLIEWITGQESELHLYKQQAEERGEALEWILEYWNRDENESAMSNALWKIIEIAEDALGKEQAT